MTDRPAKFNDSSAAFSSHGVAGETDGGEDWIAVTRRYVEEARVARRARWAAAETASRGESNNAGN